MMKKKRKPILEYPGDDAPEILKKIWTASGPGRAWKWEQWALKIEPKDSRYALAQSVLQRVKEIRAWYKKGADARANLLVEQLAQTRIAAPLIQTIEKLKPYRHGKPKGAVLESTKIIKELRSQFPNEHHTLFFRRLEKDERFAKIDDDTLQCLSDKRMLRFKTFPSLLSKLK